MAEVDIVERLKSFSFRLANRLDREGAMLTTDGAIEITRLRKENAELKSQGEK